MAESTPANIAHKYDQIAEIQELTTQIDINLNTAKVKGDSVIKEIEEDIATAKDRALQDRQRLLAEADKKFEIATRQIKKETLLKKQQLTLDLSTVENRLRDAIAKLTRDMETQKKQMTIDLETADEQENMELEEAKAEHDSMVKEAESCVADVDAQIQRLRSNLTKAKICRDREVGLENAKLEAYNKKIETYKSAIEDLKFVATNKSSSA